MSPARHRVRLRSVRTKLGALVALTSVFALVAVPVQWLALRDDLVRVVDEHAADANATARIDLDDDMTDLGATVVAAGSAP